VSTKFKFIIQVQIHYVEFPDGSVPAAELIQEVVYRGKKDSLFARMAKHIRDAMDTLKRNGVPDWNIRNFSYEWTIQTQKGWTIRVDPLIKRLNHAYPLFEFRINEWRYRGQEIEMGYGFRLIFFTYYQRDIQHVFFVNGMIKREKSPAEFDFLITEALGIYHDFSHNRWKYLRRD
jgi:hypothetical protein